MVVVLLVREVVAAGFFFSPKRRSVAKLNSLGLVGLQLLLPLRPGVVERPGVGLLRGDDTA